MNTDLFAIDHNAERCVHHVSIGIQTHRRRKEQLPVFAVSVKEISVVMTRIAALWMSNRFGSLMDRVVVKRSDHVCDRSHYWALG